MFPYYIPKQKQFQASNAFKKETFSGFESL